MAHSIVMKFIATLGSPQQKARYFAEVTGNPGIWYGWHGAVSGGITVIESTQNGQSYNVAVNLGWGVR